LQILSKTQLERCAHVDVLTLQGARGHGARGKGQGARGKGQGARGKGDWNKVEKKRTKPENSTVSTHRFSVLSWLWRRKGI